MTCPQNTANVQFETETASCAIAMDFKCIPGTSDFRKHLGQFVIECGTTRCKVMNIMTIAPLSSLGI